jgi:IclR family acetate operon transcriptional repressor
MEPFTRRTIPDVGRLEAHLETVRSSGVAFDDEEFSVGVRCVAAPVFRHDGLIAGAVGISGPSPRVSDGRISALEEIVCREATALSRKIGWHEESAPIARKA